MQVEFGKKLASGRFCTSYLVKKYSGLFLSDFIQIPVDEFIKDSKKNFSEDTWYIVECDLYWCSWDIEYYLIKHMPHYVLLVGIDEQKGIYVKDPQLAIQGKWISFETLYKAFRGYHYIKVYEKECKESPQIEDVIKLSLAHLFFGPDGNAFDMMYKFIRDFKTFKLENILDIHLKNLSEQTLLVRIKNVAMGRKQFASTLEYLYEIHGGEAILECAEDLKNIGDRWLAISGMLCKGLFISDVNREKLLEKINNRLKGLYREEKEMAVRLKKICNNKFEIKTENNLHNREIVFSENQTYVELDEYYNAKGISTTLDYNTQACFSTEGRYILLENLEYSDNIFLVGKIKYKFPRIEKYTFDSIMCMGEKVIIPNGNYVSLSFLISADMGNHFESIIINYDGALNCEEKIKIPSWLSQQCMFGENIAIKGKGVVRVNGIQDIYPFPVHIYSITVPLDTNKKILSIELPLCPNIHIFSITLCR